MVPDWFLNVMLAVICMSGGGAIWYFLSQKQFHHFLWTAVITSVLLIVLVALYLRNGIILKDAEKALTPKLGVMIAPDDWPSLALAEYKYPLQEYTLDITNNNMDSVPVENLTIEFLLPYIITQLRGGTFLYSGGPVWVRGMRKVERKNGKVIRTEEEPPESSISKSIDFSIQQWKENGQLVNSHIAVLSCEEFPKGTVFTGSIVVDLTKEPRGLIKTPDEIGEYLGTYDFTIMGKKFPRVRISGAIPKPNIEMKLAEHHYDKGNDLMKEGKCAQAISEFTTAISLNPKHAEAYFGRGSCYGKLGHHEKALEDFSKVIEISPKHAPAYFNRAIAKTKMGETGSEVKEDYRKAFGLGFDRAAKPYLQLMLPEVDPHKGFLERVIRSPKWLERNGQFITIIPHISKENFEIYAYRDRDNTFKVLISNAFSKKVILQYKNLDRLKNAPTHPKHQIKITWYKGENKLYIDGALVDLYPKEVSGPKPKAEDQKTEAFRQEGDLFREILDVDPEKGRIWFSISRLEWLDKDGDYLNILPHILTEDFEIHAYRDKDNIFKVLISNAFGEKIILRYEDLEKLKTAPSHPRHEIEIKWGKGESKLYIDGDLVDSYIKNRY